MTPPPKVTNKKIDQNISNLSNILQLDGQDSIVDSSLNSDNQSSDNTNYDTDEELYSEPIPANLFPTPNQEFDPRKPVTLDVGLNNQRSSSLPLFLVFNARSIFNKTDSLCEILQQLGPDFCLISETFETEKRKICSALKNKHYSSISYHRKNKAPGGGSAIIFNQIRFFVTDLQIATPDGIEGCWALAVPKCDNARAKRIAIGSYYVSPRSKYKQETIDHIIETIHILRARYDDIRFWIGRDFNRLVISDILDSYGALKQIISIPTRKTVTLEIVLTDLHTMYHPATTIPPLQADMDKVGKDGDHEILVLAPKSNQKIFVERKKMTISTRPLPQSQMEKFEKAIIDTNWENIFQEKSLNEKVEIFHNTLRSNLEKYCPEKITKMSNLDRDWMSPHLKQLHRKMRREFYKRRKSEKYKELKSKFKKLKRKTLRNFYSNFVSDLKETDPGKWYSMAKRIGAVDKMPHSEIKVQCLENFNNAESVQIIAEHFSRISNEYLPIDISKLPCYASPATTSY